MRSAVADLIGKTPGLRSVLSHIQKLTHLDPKDRHQMEREALARRHDREKRDFERQKRFRARIETRERQALEKAQRRKAVMTRTAAQSAEELMQAAIEARQDFHDAARDQGLWKDKAFGEGDLQVEFNDAADFVEGADRAGDDDDDRAPDWARRADQRGRSHRPKHGRKPKRGKGYGYRRDE